MPRDSGRGAVAARRLGHHIALARGRRRSSVAVALGLALAGCQSYAPNKGMPMQFTAAERPAAESDYPNWPYEPGLLEIRLPKALEPDDFETMEMERTAYGTAGARSIKLHFPEGSGGLTNVHVKWKEMPRGSLDVFNNSPRKSIAAYQLQKLFLEPEDYVVPTSFAFCVRLARYARDTGQPQRPSLDKSSCVLGVVTIWLENVTMTDRLYEEARFVADPAYAYYMANFNLFTYLVDYSDPKQSNVLVSKEGRRQVFSVDNDLAFEEVFRNFFPSQWNVIFVPALRADSIERLRGLRREDLEPLGVVAQLEKNPSGVFVPVAPGENLAPNQGVFMSGETVQLGLAHHEIEGVWQRMQDLIARVDNGEIAVF